MSFRTSGGGIVRWGEEKSLPLCIYAMHSRDACSKRFLLTHLALLRSWARSK